VNRHEFLASLHRQVRPRTYLETGVNLGQSLTLTRVPSIGIDPEFSVVRELQANIHLARTTSDEFFARTDPIAHLPIPVVDFAFIDGMHLSEYALRDYLAVERFTRPTSVVVFDDMLPRSVDEAARRRHTTAWTGDVYKAAQALRDLCPDVVVIEVDTTPTGVVVVLVPDAGRDGVLDGYDDWLDVAMAPDPQLVPTEVLSRSRALKPERLLASHGWSRLAALRGRNNDHIADEVRSAFADVIAA
jgi:predicted O-methyltransferase YrrM